MKLLKLSFLLLTITFLSACGDDDGDGDDLSCVQADWVGTYTGTQTCDGTAEEVTVTITASGTNDVVIKTETTTLETEYDPFTPNSCDIDKTVTAQGFTITIDAALATNQLTFSDVTSDGTTTSTCNLTATRN